jgi:hypothetical protein
MPEARIEFVGDVVRKRGPADRLAIEAARTADGARVGERTGRFHVPAVVRLDQAAGVLETERVHGFVSLMELALRKDSRLVGICERVGRAVAEIHADTLRPETPRMPLPAQFASDPSDECPLHGDLNGSNVGYDPSTDRVVIVDWSAAPALGVAATVGSRYFDVLWFSLFFFRFRPGTALFGWSPERWVEGFLAGYADLAETFSVDALRAYHERVLTFLTNDLRAEQARRPPGIRRIPFRILRQLDWRRWERFLASLADPRGNRREAGEIARAGRRPLDGQ